MLIKKQTILNKKVAAELQQDVSGLAYGRPDTPGTNYTGNANKGNKSIAAGVDVDQKTVTPTFTAGSLAFGTAVHPGGSDTWEELALKVRLYMGGVQVAESGYLPWHGDSDGSVYIQAASGFRALSGSQTCKNTLHNYRAVTDAIHNAMGTSTGGYGQCAVSVGSVKPG